MRENRLVKLVSPLHCNSWNMFISSNQSCFHVHPLWIILGLLWLQCILARFQSATAHVIVSSSGMPCWKIIYPKRRRRSISFWLVSYTFLYLNPPFWVSNFRLQVCFWWVVLWPKFQTLWRIQAYHFIATEAVKFSPIFEANRLSSCTESSRFFCLTNLDMSVWFTTDLHVIVFGHAQTRIKKHYLVVKTCKNQANPNQDNVFRHDQTRIFFCKRSDGK